NSGLESWKSIPNSKVTAIQDFVVADAETVYVLDSAAGQGVSKTTNSGASWGETKEPTKSAGTPHMITLAPNGDILYGGTGGRVAYSKDGGATFERVGVDFGDTNAIVVASSNYADNKGIIYVGTTDGDGTGVIKRGKTNTSTSPPASTRGSTASAITGMAVIGDITYVLSANGTDSSILYKSYKLEDADSTTLAEWSSVSASGEYYVNTPQALKLSLDDGAPQLWAIDSDSPDLEQFTDTQALTGPTLVSPASNEVIDVNPGTGRSYDVTFVWERISDTDVDVMEVEIANDAAFDATIYAYPFDVSTDSIARVIGPNGQSNQIAEFNPGATYYWRVRNGETAPMYSPWSEVRSFTVASQDAPFDISEPAVGASDVALNPILTWAEYEGAIGYEVALSEDPSFAILEWGYNEENTFFVVTEGLDYSTTYYWRVRGVTGESYTSGKTVITPAGPWVTGVFTTMAEPVAEEQAVITVPSQPEPPQIITIEKPVIVQGAPQAIPTWTLVTIIIIGAVLIIALVVLIVRTRRIA
ncbi:WD40/YVTN/BNR-like repeat-containing protein, partial [Chloroflexota bacterium]